MGIPLDGAGGDRGSLGGTEGRAAGGEQSTEKGIGRARAKCTGVTVVDWSVDWNASFANRTWLILRISVCRSSEEHGGDLTLDVQFESVAEFDHQGPEVHVSGVRD